MLGKLLKYEWKSTRRIFPLLYAAILVIAFLGGLSFRGSAIIENEIGSVLFMLIWVILIMALLVVTVVVIIARFYKNVMSQEGYLTHVLPVKTWQHIASKAIMAFIWFVLAVVVILVSVFLMAAATGDLQIVWQDISVEEIFNAIGIYRPEVILLVCCALVQTIRIILQFYAAMAIGGTANKHKILYSFLAFIVLVIAVSMVQTFLSMGVVSDVLIATVSYGSSSLDLSMTLVKQLITDAVLSAVFFILTEYFLRKKLNLE